MLSVHINVTRSSKVRYCLQRPFKCSSPVPPVSTRDSHIVNQTVTLIISLSSQKVTREIKQHNQKNLHHWYGVISCFPKRFVRWVSTKTNYEKLWHSAPPWTLTGKYGFLISLILFGLASHSFWTETVTYSSLIMLVSSNFSLLFLRVIQIFRILRSVTVMYCINAQNSFENSLRFPKIVSFWNIFPQSSYLFTIIPCFVAFHRVVKRKKSPPK